MPAYRYDIVKNNKIVATFFDRFQAHDYCEHNGGNIKATSLIG